MQAMRRVLSQAPEISPDLPADVRAVIAAAIDQDPAARPATAAELAERIEALNEVL
jgi:hypothetical protein